MVPDHSHPIQYELPVSLQTDPPLPKAKGPQLYIHAQRDRTARGIDDSTEQFINATRLGVSG
jgi:hypothetical protein